MELSARSGAVDRLDSAARAAIGRRSEERGFSLPLPLPGPWEHPAGAALEGLCDDQHRGRGQRHRRRAASHLVLLHELVRLWIDARANRAVPIPRIVAEEIALHLAQFPAGSDGLVFTAPGGGLIRRTNWRQRVWLPALRRAGIPAPIPRPHDLRHTAASLAIQAGAHPKAIQSMLGHSSITITLDRYGHMFPSVAESLAEAVDGRFREAAARSAATSVQPEPESEVVAFRPAAPGRGV